ncbi:hypothetical protein ACFY20_37800 [Streptomyces sp. NPDC001312]|uniref:hypothetical protein n=2 Tax=unclassified Streptomyces TaxID=2593676 RepID=UPI0036C18AA7
MVFTACAWLVARAVLRLDRLVAPQRLVYEVGRPDSLGRRRTRDGTGTRPAAADARDYWNEGGIAVVRDITPTSPRGGRHDHAPAVCAWKGTITMATTIDASDGIHSTIEQLQGELPGLESRKQELEQELAAVAQRLEAVRTAVESLKTLSTTTAAATTAAPKTAGRKKTGTTAQRPASRTAKKAAPRAKAAGKAGKEKAAPAKRPKGLTDGIVEILSKAKSAMKAGEINQALGRPETAGQIEAVRGTLERLVKAAQAQRAGRGLYEAARG